METSAGKELSSKDVLRVIRARLPEHVDLLGQLVAEWSHADSPRGTRKVASLLLPLLERLEFQTDVIPQTAVSEEMEWVERILVPGNRQQNLGPTYHLHRDGGRTSVLLLGDLDSSYSQAAHQRFLSYRRGGQWFGPAIADMKGGLVAMIAALTALADLGLPSPRIEIVLSSDEQAGSLGSRQVVRDAASRCEFTFCMECSRHGGKLMAARGHIGIGEIISSGTEAHAGSAFSDGDNAIDRIARLIPMLHDFTDQNRDILISVTLIEGGRRRSVIPGYARAVMDIRTPNPEAWDSVTAELERIVQIESQGKARLRTYAHRPGVEWTTKTDRLLRLISHVAQPIGESIEAFRSPAAGSSAFAAEAGSVVMDGMGPSGGGLMTNEEHIHLDTLAPRAAILAGCLAALAA